MTIDQAHAHSIKAKIDARIDAVIKEIERQSARPEKHKAKVSAWLKWAGFKYA